MSTIINNPSALSKVCLMVADADYGQALYAALQCPELVVEHYQDQQGFLSENPLTSVQCLVVSVDISGGDQGIELLEQLSASDSRVPAVVITPNHEIQLAVRAMKASAAACFELDTPLPIVVKTIRDLAFSC